MSMESTILTKPECLVYKLPPRNSVRGYRAADWGLDKPSWTGRMRVTARDEKVSIKLEDTTNGQLFAECPITEYPTKDIESVNDSSRYFVLRIQNQGRSAFIGIGFRDRGDSFDFNVALQDHYKWVKNSNEPAEPSNVPKLNLGLAEGQTFKINLAGKMNADRERPKPTSTSGISLLPPPPSKSNPGAAPSGNLLNLAAPPQAAAQPTSSTSTEDDFGDFNAPTTQSSNWVSFYMMSRKALRRAAAQSNPNCLGSSSARKASSFPPAEIAAAMRLQGPTRVQNHDFLHVFSDTKKPAVSGPLAIEMRLLPEEQQNFIRSELALIEKESSDASHTGYILQLAKEFDEFLALRFPDVKRYGLEGSETIMLWFDTILNEVDKDNHVTIGMTHRGRNNLLVCLLGLRADIMFGKMSGKPEFPFDPEHEKIIGDVLSHLQISSTLDSGVSVSLLPNPSHLDAINPAAMGKARSKMDHGGKALCIQCHGDGSLIGQ
ncbi:unnamed protein product, partial [Oikopleura dioica]